MKNSMWKIKSFNFTGWNASVIDLNEGKNQIDSMIDKCAINTMVLALGALQDHAYSTEIDWTGPHMLKDQQVIDLINHAKKRNLKTILKPMVNNRDGYWRAYIRFFDEDVPCEPKWSEWFKNYTEYMVHYARICEQESVDMLIIGCELVGTDHRSNEWRQLIKKVREVYTGLLTYNCDKYQEHNVAWWDALDVISSSGYYPEGSWDQEIKRIKRVVDRFSKPFFFSEVGCPSTKGSLTKPNDWTMVDPDSVSFEEQDRFFKIMFENCEPLDWHYGYSIWDWPLNTNNDNSYESGYRVYDKPAEKTIREYFSK